MGLNCIQDRLKCCDLIVFMTCIEVNASAHTIQLGPPPKSSSYSTSVPFRGVSQRYMQNIQQYIIQSLKEGMSVRLYIGGKLH